MNLLRSAGLAIASLVVFLALLEAGVRLLVPEARWRYLDATADWNLDPELGWVNRPDLDVGADGMFGPVRFRTNRDGLIPAEATREKPPGATRIMIFGDSMVVGRYVAQDRIYTARLGPLLAQRGIRADVINAGVQGYSTDQALLLMQRWVPVYHPDVVLYGSTLNDYGGIELATAYEQAKPVYRIDEHARLRLALPHLAPELHPFGATGPRRWVQKSALYRLIQPGIFLLRSRLFGLQERILLGTEQGVYIGDQTVDSLDWPLYEALVVRMKETADKQGARFLFFAHPEVGEVWEPYIEMVCRKLRVERDSYDPYAMESRLVAMARRRGLAFLPVIGTFRDVPERGPFHPIPTDGHLNEAGHRLLAEFLADRIAAELGGQADAAGALRSRPERTE
jgi:lysophospholipase L1-like esterase